MTPREWRVAIVEDEPIARLGLRSMVNALPDATLVGEATTAAEAVRLLHDARPDIVFLDVNLPGSDAFDVLARAPVESPPTIVLVTAFDEYAVRAYDLGVTDYLLKPFDEKRFTRAWERAVAARVGSDARTTPATVEASRLLLRRDGRVHAVPLSEVEWIEAADNYVRVHAEGGRFMWRQPLRQVAASLGAAGFAQASRSAVVNVRHVMNVLPLESGDARVQLRSGAEISVSRRFRAAFQEAIRSR